MKKEKAGGLTLPLGDGLVSVRGQTSGPGNESSVQKQQSHTPADGLLLCLRSTSVAGQQGKDGLFKKCCLVN